MTVSTKEEGKHEKLMLAQTGTGRRSTTNKLKNKWRQGQERKDARTGVRKPVVSQEKQPKAERDRTEHIKLSTKNLKSHDSSLIRILMPPAEVLDVHTG